MISRHEFEHFLRFCVVGVANTLVHVGAVMGLADGAHIAPPLANVLAFCIANVFSYFVNTHWTFRTRASWAIYTRFLAVSLVGAGLSWGAVECALLMHLHYLIGVVASIGAVAVVGYGLNRLFVFRLPAVKNQ